MCDGFQLVKKKRNRKHKFQFESLNPDSDCESVKLLTKKLTKAQEEFGSSQFCFEATQAIKTCIEKFELSSIENILCFGLGNFSESKSSLHQLAALCTFQKFLNSTIKIYDPVFSSVEIELLKNLNFEVLTENDEGKQKILKTTLAYFPHCPKQLTNNFLWANWNTNLQKCVLISNSFTKIVQDNTKKVLEESAKYILKIHPKTQEVVLEDNYPTDNTFNDLSVHCFNSTELTAVFFQQTLEKEPVYLTDTELITKDIKKIDLQNEQ